MLSKDVLLLLTDNWADWEASYAIAEVNSVPQYAVKTIAEDKKAKISIGGLRSEIDLTLEEYTDLSNLALLILPGGFSWQKNEYKEIAAFIEKVLKQNIPVAAICGATIFLGKNGFLDKVKHTGDRFELFSQHEAYKGTAYFMETQAVLDKGILTANETAAVEFAYEIFNLLAISDGAEIEEWYTYYQEGMFDSSQKTAK